MPNAPRTVTARTGIIPNLQPIMLGEGGTLTVRQLSALSDTINSLVRAVNGRLSFGDGSHGSWSGNIDGHTKTVYFAEADTDYEVPHGLGRKPIGIVLLSADNDGPTFRTETVELTGQSASIAATDMTGGTLAAGLYRVSYYLRVTTAEFGSSIYVTLDWVTGGVTRSRAGTLVDGSSTANSDTATFLIRSDALAAVRYSTTYGGATLQYALDVLLEEVGGGATTIGTTVRSSNEGSWTPTRMFVRCNVAGVTARFVVI